ncbi:hypothetical protein Thiosp_02366 [Thiorhodovibrio litoralis]|nr:hypothetical protein [Thiorhodovibrio winogradskyi]WPL12592.1 hypothetical protein Thiosp_02366 [Thiorhodovibrio litoralis]
MLMRLGMRPRNRRRPLALRLFMALLAVGLFVIGYQWGNQSQRGQGQTVAIEGVRLRPAVPLPSWQLTDDGGQPRGSDQFEGFWVLLGFAPIDDVSGHLTMTRMLEVFNRLADQPAVREQLRLVLVSPRMDAALAQDFRRLLTQIWVLSGSPEQLARLDAMLAGSTAKEGAALYLIDPEARLTAIFPNTQPPAAIARDMRLLAKTTAQEP